MVKYNGSQNALSGFANCLSGVNESKDTSRKRKKCYSTPMTRCISSRMWVQSILSKALVHGKGFL